LNRLYQEQTVTSTLSVEALAALAVLRQVWLQQYQVEDEVVRWRPAGQLPPASILIESPYDDEARFGQKRELTWIGYRAHLSESCEETEPHLVTQVKTTVVPTADISMTAEIQADLVAKGFTPAIHLLDAGYVDAAALVKSQEEYGIQIVGQVKLDASPQAQAKAGLAAADFAIDWDKQQATCPQGHTSQGWSKGPDVGGVETIRIRFAKTDCAVCPLRQLCTSAQQGRTLRVRLKAQHEALQAARLAQTTPEFKAAYNQRAGIESTISQAVRGFDLRRSRYLGLAKTHLQNVLIAIAINLTRLAAWLDDQPQEKTRISHFAALALP
jgi:transposase